MEIQDGVDIEEISKQRVCDGEHIEAEFRKPQILPVLRLTSLQPVSLPAILNAPRSGPTVFVQVRPFSMSGPLSNQKSHFAAIGSQATAGKRARDALE